MCRHLAYLGPPASLRELLLDPPHGLYRQSWAPRRQRHGTVNADGFGIGWYADGDPVPARYRRDIPIWNDPSLPDIARVTRSGAVLAAVRSATPGTAQGAAAAAPFGAGTWLFSHNGVLRNWREFESRISVTDMESLTDSALLWALTARLLRAGASAVRALAAVIAEVEAAGGSGRFNFLLTDGQSVAATAAGDTLCYRRAGGGVTVASEPCDDEPGWTDVPDRHLLTAGPDGVTVTPLAVVLSQPSPDAPTAPPRRSRGSMIIVDNLLPAGFRESSLKSDVLTGLSATPKWLPPKWFYDAEGSALFEKITELPEYYPTRAERAILRAASGEIAAASHAETLVELGSGSSEKTRLLLDALRQAGTLRRYVPVDVSESALRAAGSAVDAEYPGLDVHAVVADFDTYLGPGASGNGSGPRLVAFLGSTIGNMMPEERAAFLSRVRSTLRPGDAFLLGTDLVKDPSVLVAAYDDSAGVTAAFNKNVLSVLNASLGADFDLDAFDHVAVWDPRAEWIEMRLRSTASQEVRVPGVGLTVPFGAGEEMRTEVSAKFRRARVAVELAAAGFELRSWWTDDAAQFGLSLSVPA